MFNVTIISNVIGERFREFSTLPQAMRYVRANRNRLEKTVLHGAGSFTIFLGNQNDDILGCWEANWWNTSFNW